jgi:hypothetical protein
MIFILSYSVILFSQVELLVRFPVYVALLPRLLFVVGTYNETILDPNVCDLSSPSAFNHASSSFFHTSDLEHEYCLSSSQQARFLRHSICLSWYGS